MGKGSPQQFGNCRVCNERRERCEECRSTVCGCMDCGCYSDYYNWQEDAADYDWGTND